MPKDTGFNSTTLLDRQLEIPCQERLLPIGQHNKDISQFVDKVKQALGLNMHIYKMDDGKAFDQIKRDDHEHHLSHSPRKLIKQVALESPPNQGEYYENSMTVCKSLKIDNNQSKRWNCPLSLIHY